MSSIERRRRAWAALKLGPLWQPVAGLLPHAPVVPIPPATAWASEAEESARPDDPLFERSHHATEHALDALGHDGQLDSAASGAALVSPASDPAAAVRSVSDQTPDQDALGPTEGRATGQHDTSGQAPVQRPSREAAAMPSDMPHPDDGWLPGGAMHDTPEEAWLAMAAEAAHFGSSSEPMLGDEHGTRAPAPPVGSSAYAFAPRPTSSAVTLPPTPAAPPAAGTTPAQMHKAVPRSDFGSAGGGPGMHDAPEAFDALADVPSPAVSRPDRSLPEAERWQQLREAVNQCRRCGLADTRQNTVFGRGQTGKARWMLIGEAPGAEEDRRGEAFVGQAGQLLDAMLTAAGIDPAAEVFIANVLKCRPPGNRNPELHEVNQCEGFLHEQIRLADPDCILLLGRFAAQSVLNSSLSINRLRHRVHHLHLAGREVPVVCTFHPAYLLRNPLDKLKSWEDLCLARSVLKAPGNDKLPLPSRRSAPDRNPG